MFDKIYNIENKEDILMKTKFEFNKLVKEAKKMKDMENITEKDKIKNMNYIDLLKSNIDFIENEYKSNIDFDEYSKAINILNNNISNLQNRFDNFNI